jgi:hypothetical protein
MLVNFEREYLGDRIAEDDENIAKSHEFVESSFFQNPVFAQRHRAGDLPKQSQYKYKD